MPSPPHAAAPARGRGGSETQRAADTDSVGDEQWLRWVDPAYRAEHAAREGERNQQRACLALSHHLAAYRPSEAWERAWLNEVARDWGFDPEYLEHRFGVARRAVTA